MNSTLLTPAQTAQLLGVSTSALRLWSEQFKDHLSAAARGDGRHRRHYSSDDLATLQRVKTLLGEGRTVADVSGLLAVVDTQAGAIVTVSNLAAEVVSTREILAAMRQEWQAAQAEHDKAIAELRGEVATLRDELATLQRRGWWDRLLNRHR